MWIVAFLFLVPGLLELFEPSKTQYLGLIWLGLAIATSPGYPVGNRARILAILTLFVGFVAVQGAAHEGLLTDDINWAALTWPATAILASLMLFTNPLKWFSAPSSEPQPN